MRLVEARQAMNRQMEVLNYRRQKIQGMLKEQKKTGSTDFDRVELSKELEALDQAYEETSQERERLNMLSMNIQNAEASKQQAEAEAEAYEEMLKCLEIFRRIANGDKVPPGDEKKLMNYDGNMYLMAKSMSVIHKDEEGKTWDSLWEDKEEKGENPDPAELAANTEVGLAMPSVPKASALAAQE